MRTTSTSTTTVLGPALALAALLACGPQPAVAQPRPTARPAMVRSSAADPWDGRRAATAHWGGDIRIWDTDSARTIASWKGHDQSGVRVGCLSWSPDGTRLAGGISDNTVQLWDPATGAGVLTVPYDTSVWDVTWAPDGERLAVIVLDHRVRLLSAAPAASRSPGPRP